MTRREPFNSIYAQGFLRAAVCAPKVALASPERNLEETLKLAKQASAQEAALAVFPELGLTGYSNDDLFFQDALLDGAQEAITELVRASRELKPVRLSVLPSLPKPSSSIAPSSSMAAGIPGAVPKTYLPNYREFYQKRQFTSGTKATAPVIQVGAELVPFGSDLIFVAENYPDFTVHVEICEDLWTPLPPSSYAALAGAMLLANLSASNITIGKAEYRGGCCARANRVGASRPTSTRRRASANPRPTSPGTGRA